MWRHFVRTDLLPSPLYWPDQIVLILLKPHRENRDRLNLFLFFVGNGVPLDIAHEYSLLFQTFDYEAQQQLISLTKNIRKYALNKPNGYQYHDLTLNQTIPFSQSPYINP